MKMAAINTDYLPEKQSTHELEMLLKRISEAGFTHIHWGHEWDGDYIYSIYEMFQIREWMDKYGLKAKGLHASKGSKKSRRCYGNHIRNDECRKDYTSINEYNRKAGLELIQNRVDMAYILGASEIVLHMCLPFESFSEPGYEELYYRQAFRSLDELEPYCKARGVRIAIENMLAPDYRMQTEQFERLFHRYDKEYMGMCLDTGHTLLSDDKDHALELAKRFQQRIYCVHSQDNKGLGDVDFSNVNREEAFQLSGIADLHLVPYDGIFPFDSFLEILAGAPYELPVLLETVNDTEEDEMQFLTRNYEISVRMNEMVEKYRSKMNESAL